VQNNHLRENVKPISVVNKRLDFLASVQYCFNMIEDILIEMSQTVIDGDKERSSSSRISFSKRVCRRC